MHIIPLYHNHHKAAKKRPKKQQQQPKRRMMQIDTSFLNANGLFQQLNLGEQLMKRVAKKCPIIRNTGREGNNRGNRCVLLNDTTLTSKPLLEQLRIEIERQ